jgi:hypothetical protein
LYPVVDRTLREPETIWMEPPPLTVRSSLPESVNLSIGLAKGFEITI